jgi:hypothetical protein
MLIETSRHMDTEVHQQFIYISDNPCTFMCDKSSALSLCGKQAFPFPAVLPLTGQEGEAIRDHLLVDWNSSDLHGCQNVWSEHACWPP